jgi:hypothetical protein
MSGAEHQCTKVGILTFHKAVIRQPKPHGNISSWMIMLATIAKKIKYIGGLVCAFGGIYLGNAYGASYWRFGPLNLAWDTIFRGTVLVVIGLLLIRFSK